jgi:hypothetical protein
MNQVMAISRLNCDAAMAWPHVQPMNQLMVISRLTGPAKL